MLPTSFYSTSNTECNVSTNQSLLVSDTSFGLQFLQTTNLIQTGLDPFAFLGHALYKRVSVDSMRDSCRGLLSLLPVTYISGI